MNFAPYQDDNPERVRALSPPPPKSPPPQRVRSPFSPPEFPRPFRPEYSYQSSSAHQDFYQRDEHLPAPDDFENNEDTDPYQYRISDPSAPEPQPQQGQRGFGNDGRDVVDIFGTSLPLRLDYEACLAYLLLPPAGGALLLIFEHKSDYIRFHAWQSSLLFGFLFLVHLIFSFSRAISIILLVVDLLLIGWLTSRAYRDAITLERCEVPFFGPIASSFVDQE